MCEMYRITREDVAVAVPVLDELCFPADERVVIGDAYWWVVWHGQDPVGFAGLRVCQAEYNRGLAFLCRAGVVPTHRGAGLQKRLIRVREREARRLGVRQLVTYCVAENLASANSLLACGFKLYRPEHRWGGAAAMYWRKIL
jgi:predicted acetyltransferase